jgi:CheY-like chemotaxis protein
MTPGTHMVQFYEHDSQLRRGVQTFVDHARNERQPCVMIARRRTFEGVIGADSRNGVRFIDAQAALDAIMDGHTPDTALFEKTLSQLWNELKPAGSGALWIYGEMVDMLSEAGNYEAAIRLEKVGQGVLEKLPVAIMCGYGLEHFDTSGEAKRLHAVCQHHTDVMLTGSSGQAPGGRAANDGEPILEQPARAFELLRRYGSVAVAYALRGATVVVIDDDASVRRSIERMLRLNGLRVRAFASAEAFLAEADATPTGCLILDIQLLGMSGLDLQGQLAASAAQIPVIAMSGSANAKLERETRRLGARVFLRKPFDPDALLSAVLNALGPRRWVI